MRNFLIKLPRNIKRSLLIAVDIISIYLVFWISLMLRSGNTFLPSEGYELTKASPESVYITFLLISLVTIPIFILFRLYRSVIRYISLETYVKITKATFISSLLSGILVGITMQPIPKSAFLIYFVLLTIIMFYSRYTARSYLINNIYSQSKNILIYDTTESSKQVHEILKSSDGFNIRGFVTNDKKFETTSISEIPVYMIEDIEKITNKLHIDEIIMLPEKKGTIEIKILEKLKKVQNKLRKIPDLNKIAKGIIIPEDIQKIDIEDLLGRDAVKPDPYLLRSCIDNKNVMITGCGGSIGSSLAKLIITLNPKSLILVERSEYFLYEILNELSNIQNQMNLDLKIESYQGSVEDKNFITSIFKANKIDTVYHAAANKHVPLVEKNPVDAIKTNIFGTFLLADTAYKNNIENFVLISSDKAVRPTNIMGATKRFSEMILQSLQEKINDMPSNVCRTKFCMVRFGNVLDTSGSVVPLFRKQIKEGGPVTVTDPEVIRYFMTIQEATELVIQAGSLSRGGDVFLLEMGKPVNILELAKQMIILSGCQVKDDNNPTGDIEIEFTGLREGEKLYEELLIGDRVEKTAHKSIMRAIEEKLSYDEVLKFIDRLKTIKQLDSKNAVKEVLQEAIGNKITPKNNVVDIHIT